MEGKRGRHRATPEADGVSLSAVADHFNANRKTVARWMREGLPHFRRGGRIFVDLKHAADWVAEHEREEADTLPRAKRLHPNDPRWAEREARAKLLHIKGLIDSGRAIDAAPAFQKYIDSVAAIFARFGEMQIADDHAAAVESILAYFSPEAGWPEPVDVVDEAADDDGSEFENLDAEFIPVLDASDPRATVARTQAARYQRKIAELEPGLVELGAYLEWLRGEADEVRRAVRAMPACIAALVRPGDDGWYVEAAINFVADSVRFEFCKRHGVESEWEPTPPTRLVIDLDSVDDVDGIATEFEGLDSDDDEHETDDDRYERADA